MEKSSITEIVNKSLVSVAELIFSYFRTAFLLFFNLDGLNSSRNKLNGYVMLAINIFLSTKLAKWVLGSFFFLYFTLLNSCSDIGGTEASKPKAPALFSEYSLEISTDEFTKVVLPSFLLFLVLISLFERIHGRSDAYRSVLLYTLSHWLLSVPVIFFIAVYLGIFSNEISLLALPLTILWPCFFYLKFYKLNFLKMRSRDLFSGPLFIITSVGIFGFLLYSDIEKIIDNYELRRKPPIEAFLVDEKNFVLTILLINNYKTPTYIYANSRVILKENSEHHLVEIDGNKTTLIFYSASESIREKLQECNKTLEKSPLVRQFNWRNVDNIVERVHKKADVDVYKKCWREALSFRTSFNFINVKGESFHGTFDLFPVNYFHDRDSHSLL